MPRSNTATSTIEHDDHTGPVEAGDLFERMLEAEIMGSGTYGADPDLDLIEERLSQLRQGSETPTKADEPAPEIEPEAEIEPVAAVVPMTEAEPPAVAKVMIEAEPEQVVPAPPPTAPPAAAVRPTAPPVIVSGNRPAAFSGAATSADAVVLEAARAAGVAPAYRQPAASQTSKAAPAPRQRRKRASRLPSFYFAVLTLLLASFALFAVWRSVPDELIVLPKEVIDTIATVVPAVPSLPDPIVRTEAPVDPQMTASVSNLPSTADPEFSAPTSRPGSAPRRIVKLYRVDAQGNIIGYTPTP
jgi:hypothetical protein